MAVSSSLHLIIAAAITMLASTAMSLTCKSQTFSQHFANCSDLRTLKATLHWNYGPTAKPKPTLSVAFIAPPPKPDGWVAWELNPTGRGMVGAQALVAFPAANGSTVVVKTYNISARRLIKESAIAYGVLSKRAESSKGVITIFATLALPTETAELNQVWQVGTLFNGVLAIHAFAPDNLYSNSWLQLEGAVEDGKSPAFAQPVAASPLSQSGNVSGDGSVVIGGSRLGVYIWIICDACGLYFWGLYVVGLFVLYYCFRLSQ